jgi:NAD(P)-dependent dehydrogenase (short-subunit alcohol dehydrogenase family)
VLRKRSALHEWFYAPAWKPSPPPPRPATEGQPRTWLIFTDESPLAEKLIALLRARGGRVVQVAAAERSGWRSESFFTVGPGQRSDYDFLAMKLRESGVTPDRIVHLWSCSAQSRAREILRSFAGRGEGDALEGYDKALELNYFSLLFLAQTFAPDADATRIFVVSTHLQAFPGAEVRPEKAVVLGACKVIPREYPGVSCVSIDIEHASSPRDRDRLASQLARELESDAAEGEIVLRASGRWTRAFEGVALDHQVAEKEEVLRQGAVVLVTGGLGGIGLSVAEHLAERVHARLVLVGRRPLVPAGSEDEWIASHPPEDETSRKIARVRALRQRTEVMTVAADVTDLEAMRQVLSESRARFGAIHAVFHAAGVLKDELIALRSPTAKSDVIDTKARGALVLDALLQRDKLDAFVLFSSVSSFLGLPGQSDYTAANAFLDAFAHARSAARPEELTLSINWNGWQEVGMLADLVRVERARTTDAPTPLFPSRKRRSSFERPGVEPITGCSESMSSGEGER